jgi:colicin import membrane protein
MKAGYAISAVAHAVILGWGLYSFSVKPLEAPEADAVVADVITETEFSQITAGMKTAKQMPKPTPVIDKVGDVREPPKEPMIKVAAKQEVLTTTVPPPSPPEVKPPPDPKPTDAKAEPQPSTPAPPAAAAEPPTPSDPVAEAIKREEETRKKEEAKKLEEAKKRAEAKKREEARKREETKKHEEVKRDLSRIETALLDRRAPQRQAVTGTIVNPTPSLGATTGTAPQLSQSEIERLKAMLQQQLSACWNPPVGVREARDLKVGVRFQLNRDGSLAGEPVVINRTSHPMFHIAAESAVRAVRSCQPLRLPVAKYEFWQDVEVNFDPIEMFGG